MRVLHINFYLVLRPNLSTLPNNTTFRVINYYDFTEIKLSILVPVHTRGFN
jgi:hypothetical protein